MNLPESKDSLARVLTDWRVTPGRTPEFRAAVQARLQRREAGSWRAFARAHAGVFTAALALAVVVGGWAGRGQAKARLESDRAQIVAAYVQTYDARAMALR